MKGYAFKFGLADGHISKMCHDEEEIPLHVTWEISS
jgi:hypothetical protein